MFQNNPVHQLAPDDNLRSAGGAERRREWGIAHRGGGPVIPSSLRAHFTFYADKLGFELRLDMPVEQFGGRRIEMAPPGAATTIALVPAGAGVSTGVETGVRITTRDAAAVHADLQTRGVDVGRLLRWPGVPPMFSGP